MLVGGASEAEPHDLLVVRPPGLREAMVACRAGDALVVTKLDRLARSLPDARDIVAELPPAR